jgi:hypothetical protein
MAITIKRSNLQLKNAPGSEGAPSSGLPPSLQAPMMAPPEEIKPFWAPYAIMGLLGVLMMIVVVFLQYSETDYYKNAFPVLTPGSAASTAPATAQPEAKPAKAKTEVPAAQVEVPAAKAEAPATEPAKSDAEPAKASPEPAAPAAEPAKAATAPEPAPAAPAAEPAAAAEKPAVAEPVAEAALPEAAVPEK